MLHPVCRVEDSLKLLHGRHPTGRVLLLGLLPRVPAPEQAGGAGPTPEGFPWPSPLAAGIMAVNERLAALADRCRFPLNCAAVPANRIPQQFRSVSGLTRPSTSCLQTVAVLAV
jgi:hypothetical protein